MRNGTRNFIFVENSQAINRYSKDVQHAVLPYDMDIVNFLRHENPPIRARVESAILGVQDEHQTNYDTHPELLCV
ncbi:hypothetical protein TNCV_2655831 [Trichonephila clavipes]|nr:hypothetical protein TNCV_2655831 [Trichonephila clavipes]